MNPSPASLLPLVPFAHLPLPKSRRPPLSVRPSNAVRRLRETPPCPSPRCISRRRFATLHQSTPPCPSILIQSRTSGCSATQLRHAAGHFAVRPPPRDEFTWFWRGKCHSKCTRAKSYRPL
ncbi:uncharacterized protein LOC130997734 isoform X2 [Salvia miltiorrhiza]|uniref:uncharacterized protein LOC130997734 isoform X2 n=1 Tax=Salvia miltiorrhiza TaxID=226208 RepID=UPI0025AB8593|nr:uncharacterized protein LOC130997734 isoform X2 [Salvia miltiorrhiza]